MGCNQMGRCKAAWVLVLLCMALEGSAETDTVTGDHRVCLIRHDSRAKLDNATASQSGGIDYGSQVSLSRCVSACSSDVHCNQTIYDKSKGECYGSKVATEAVDGNAEGFTTMRCEKAPHLPMTKVCRIHSQRGVTPADKPDQLDMNQVKYGEATKTEQDCLMPCSQMEKCAQSTWSIADKKCYPASKAGLMFNQKVGSGGHTIIQCVDQSEETAAEINKAAQGNETDTNKANKLAADLAKEITAEKDSELLESKKQVELLAAEQTLATEFFERANKAMNYAQSANYADSLKNAREDLAARNQTLTDTTAKAAAAAAELVKAQAAADEAKSKEKELRAKVTTKATPEEQQAQDTADADTKKANADLSELGKLETAEKIAFTRVQDAVQRKLYHAAIIKAGLEGKELAYAKEEERKTIAGLGQAQQVHSAAKEQVQLHKVTAAKAKLAAEEAEAANEKSQKAAEGAEDDTQNEKEKETSSQQTTSDAQQLEKLEATQKDALEKVAVAQKAKDAADELAASGLEGKELEAAQQAAATAVVTLAQAQKVHVEAKAKTGEVQASIKKKDDTQLEKLEASEKDAVEKVAVAQKAKDAATKLATSGLKDQELEAAQKAEAAAVVTLAQAQKVQTEAKAQTGLFKESIKQSDDEAQDLEKLEAAKKDAVEKVAVAQKAKDAADTRAASGLEGDVLEAAKEAAAAAAATLAQAKEAQTEAEEKIQNVKASIENKAKAQQQSDDAQELGKLEASEKDAVEKVAVAQKAKDAADKLATSGLEGEKLEAAKKTAAAAVVTLAQAQKVHVEAKAQVELHQASIKQMQEEKQEMTKLEASEKDAVEKVAAAQKAKDAATKLTTSGLKDQELEAAKQAEATAVAALAQMKKAEAEAKAKIALFKASQQQSKDEKNLGKLEASEKAALEKVAAAQKSKDTATKLATSGLEGAKLAAAKQAEATAVAALAQVKKAEAEAKAKTGLFKESIKQRDDAQLGKLEASEKGALEQVAVAQKAKDVATKLVASGLKGKELEAAKQAATAAVVTLAQAKEAHVEAKAQVGHVKDFAKQRAEAQQAVIKQRNEAELRKLETGEKVAVQKVAAALKARDAATDHAESGLEGEKLKVARKAVATAVDTLADLKKAQTEAQSQLGLFKASNPETVSTSAAAQSAAAAKKALEEYKKQEVIAKAVALERKKELLAAKIEIINVQKSVQSSQVEVVMAKQKLKKASQAKLKKIAEAELAEAQKVHKMHATEYASLLKETKEKKMEAAHAKERDMKAQQNFETAKRQLELAKMSSEKSNKSDKWYAQGHLLFAQGVKYQGLLQKYETANNKLDAYHYTKELHTFTKAFPQGFTAPLRDGESKPYHSKDIPAGSDSNLLKPGSIVALQGGKLRRFCTSTKAKFTLECNQKVVGENEKFRVVSAGNGKVALKTLTKSTFCGLGGRSKGYQLECNKKTIGEKEKFTIHAAPAGSIALQGHTDHYCSDGATITCRKDDVKRNEMFTAKCITNCD